MLEPESSPPRGLGERLLVLRGVPLLRSLPAADLALIARLSRERDVSPGEALALEGQPVQAVQLIVSGRAAVSQGGLPVDTAGAFDTVGLLPVAAGVPHPFEVVAIEPVHALEIDADLVAEMLEDDFPLFARVLRLGAAWALARLQLQSQSQDRRREPASEDGAPPRDAAETLLLLLGTSLFRRAPIDGLAALAKRLTPVELDPGAEIELPASARAFVVVVAGRARATAHATAPAAPVGPGTVLGVLEALGQVGGTRELAHERVRLRAETRVHLLRGTSADLLDVLEDHHAFGRRLLAALLA